MHSDCEQASAVFVHPQKTPFAYAISEFQLRDFSAPAREDISNDVDFVLPFSKQSDAVEVDTRAYEESPLPRVFKNNHDRPLPIGVTPRPKDVRRNYDFTPHDQWMEIMRDKENRETDQHNGDQ